MKNNYEKLILKKFGIDIDGNETSWGANNGSWNIGYKS